MLEENGKIEICVSTEAYPLDVIYRVCYQFTDHYYLWLTPDLKGIKVIISPKKGKRLPDSLDGEFGNALIDFAVRWAITRETTEVRNRIVSTALAEAIGEGDGHE